MLKAVIFDMDGVLIDSELVFFEANRLLMEKLGKEFNKEYNKQFVGTTCDYMWRKIIKDYSLDVSVEYMDAEGARIVKELLKTGGFPPVPFSGEFVKRLSGKVKLAIASSSSISSIERNMEEHGLRQYFDKVVSGVTVENPKPAPDVFLKAASELGVEPEECLVIEDSCNGVKAAKAAGMACIGYVNPNSEEQDLSQADCLLLGFEEADFHFVEKVHNHTFDIPWTIAETKRLCIKEMSEEECHYLRSLLKDEDITEITGLTEKEYEETLGNDDYMRSYRENMYKFYGLGLWTLKNKTSGEIVGFAGVDKNLNLSYIIQKKFRGLGFCREAIAEIMKYVFEITGEKYIFAKINRDNRPSVNLVKSMGFEQIEPEVWRRNEN